MHDTGWSRGLEVSGGGQGVVSHAGLALLRHLADKTGLTDGLSRALATPRFLVHDRGRVTADLACAIADGARVISDFRVMSDQRELFGLVASVPTAWRTLKEIARGGTRADKRITQAVNTARRHAWAQAQRGTARCPGSGSRTDPGRCHLHPAGCHRDGRALGQGAGGAATSRDTAITRCWRCAITPAGSRWPGCCGLARPGGDAATGISASGRGHRRAAAGLRRKLMITCDGAGASHDPIGLDRLASRHGYEVTCSVGWALGAREKAAMRQVPEMAWQIAVDARGQIRERRADDACTG